MALTTFELNTYVQRYMSFVQESKDNDCVQISLKNEILQSIGESQSSKIDDSIKQFWFSSDVENLIHHAVTLRQNLIDSVKQVVTFQKQRQMELAIIVVIWIKMMYNQNDKIIRVPNYRDLRPIIEKVTPSGTRKRSYNGTASWKTTKYVINTLVSIFYEIFFHSQVIFCILLV